MPPRYKRSRPSSSVAARQRPTSRSTTAPPPPDAPPTTPAPLPFEMASPEQRERYNKLALRPILPNRFIDESALIQTGLRDAVIEPLNRIGWGQFLAMKDLVYAPLTLEFLSSYSSLIRFLPLDFPSKIKFRLFGRDFELAVNEVSQIFGFPIENAQHQVPKDFNERSVWNDLTGLNSYNPRISKASKLKNPALRYIHKFLANTVFGRSESDGVLGLNELYFLWAIDNGIQLNVGYWLCHRWARIARADKGTIMMGSFVTRIAQYVQLWNPERPIYNSVGGGKSTRLDLEVMIHMKLVEKIGDHYRLVNIRDDSSDDEEAAEEAAATDMEEGNPPSFPTFGTSSGAGTARAGPSFSGTSQMSNDEVLARMLSRMDLFDSRITGMESMITDRFQSLEITQGSIDSRLDTVQNQLQTVIQLLQPPPPPPET